VLRNAQLVTAGHLCQQQLFALLLQFPSDKNGLELVMNQSQNFCTKTFTAMRKLKTLEFSLKMIPKVATKNAHDTLAASISCTNRKQGAITGQKLQVHLV
jgi:hypothetical protein